MAQIVPRLNTPRCSARAPEMLLDQYDSAGFFDEMTNGGPQVRNHYRRYVNHFSQCNEADFETKRRAVDLAFLRQGITFNVYGDSQGAERIFPFDLVPRLIPA